MHLRLTRIGGQSTSLPALAGKAERFARRILPAYEIVVQKKSPAKAGLLALLK
jgi:hypothetical protein